MPEKKISRRSFILSLFGLIAATGTFRKSIAAAAPISETDPMASALGYKHDASKADSAKYPQLKKPEAKNQLCSNCSFYKSESAEWGKCQLLQSGLVNAKGWCASWIKKA